MNKKDDFPIDFQNKKILLVGLGILGGGVATALWFLKRKAQLTITDLRSEKELASSIKKLLPYRRKIKFVFNKHRFLDFKNPDLIIVNPAVKIFNNPYLEYAKRYQRPIENDLSFFFKINKNPKICITGTRGKTTTAYWVYSFLKTRFKNVLLGGNIPEAPIFSLIEKIKNQDPIVLEVSSFQLELFNDSPKIAVITNLYPDHLNRYSDMKTYAKTKARIFLNQKGDDYLVLNYDNPWTKFFLSLKPQSQVYFFSLRSSFKGKGVFVRNNRIYFREEKKEFFIASIKNFRKHYGDHNLSNLLSAILVAKLAGLNFKEIKKQIPRLPQVKMREEKIFENERLLIINDSASTSPEAGISALERFSQKRKNLILITGGTDKNLNFQNLAFKIKKLIPPQNLVLLSGSATEKLLKELKKINYSNFYHLFDNLKECLSYAFSLAKKKKSIILFSPSSASFEKFKNEFDRGRKFNLLVKQMTKSF